MFELSSFLSKTDYNKRELERRMPPHSTWTSTLDLDV